MSEEIKSKMGVTPEMGVDTSHVFSGNVKSEALKKFYGESAKLFADLIKRFLPVSEGGYTLADLGSFKGELLEKILEELGADFHIKTIAIDINEEALKGNTADERVVSSVDALPIADKTIDISIMRYVLQWNSFEKQREILKEMDRVTKKLAIIQHCCPDDPNANEWREHMDDVLDGEEVAKMKRSGHYFSSPSEVEGLMTDLGIRFQRISELNIRGVSEIFIERYALSTEEAEKVRRIFGKFDYQNIATWVILPDSLE
jgi:SAM-dependent methyltransferase